MTNIKVFILIPSSGQFSDELAVWLRHTEKIAPYYVDWDRHYGRPNDSARNGIVKRFLEDEREFTHLWQIDDDCVPSPNAFEMVLHDKNIVSGVVYIWKDGAPFALIMERDANGEYKQNKEAIGKLNSGERLVQVDTTGTGCFVAKRAVYENLVADWFRYGYNNIGIMDKGQDFVFFAKCNEIGYTTWIDGNVQVGHFKSINILEVQRTLMQHEQQIRKEYEK